MALLCNSCAGSMIYDPDVGKMVCSRCGGFSEVRDAENTDKFDLGSVYSDTGEARMMDFEVRSCSTCGAKISYVGAEITTACPYCGNTSVTDKRSFRKRRPDAIIPFMFGQKKAEEIVRKHLMWSLYMSASDRKMEFTSVRGIYVPYYIVNADYKRVASLEYKNYDEDGTLLNTIYKDRSAAYTFDQLTIEASRVLLDEASQRIEPYDLFKLQPFNEGYLQGFSADMADEDGQTLYRKGREACLKMAEACYKDKGGDPKYFHIIDEDVRLEFNGRPVYALFPVWFVTGKSNGKNVTFLVNGESGAVIGGPPFSERAFKTSVFALSAVAVPVCALITTALLAAVLSYFNKEAPSIALIQPCIPILIGMAVAAGLVINKDRQLLSKVRSLSKVSGSDRLVRFVERRTKDE